MADGGFASTKLLEHFRSYIVIFLSAFRMVIFPDIIDWCEDWSHTSYMKKYSLFLSYQHNWHMDNGLDNLLNVTLLQVLGDMVR